MSYSDVLAADRRLVLLRLLERAPGYELNSSVLQIGLAEFGHAVSRDVAHTDLAWLCEQGLVRVRELATVRIATLEGRGIDVALGRSIVPGIKRPGPGS